MPRPGLGTCSNGTVSRGDREQGGDASLSDGETPPSCYAEGGFRSAGLDAEHVMGRCLRGFDVGDHSGDTTWRTPVS